MAYQSPEMARVTILLNRRKNLVKISHMDAIWYAWFTNKLIQIRAQK
jgi:hypothetical protein